MAQPRLRVAVCLLAFGVAVQLRAQLLELNGGTSSIYQAGGGTLSLLSGAYRMDLSAGVVAGRAVAGAELQYRYKHTDLIMGTDMVRLDLPTDIFQSNHRLMGVGAGMRRKTEDGGRFEAFAGATSMRFDTPLFEGVRAEKPAGAFLMDRSLSPTLKLSTQVVYATSLSTIETLAWSRTPELKVAFSGGRGNGSRYEAASVDLKRPQFDLKAAYIDAGPHFQRTGSQIDLSPEPIRENILFDWRSQGDSRLLISGGRQHFVVSTDAVNGTLPDAPSVGLGVSTLDQLSASARFVRTGLTASVLHSTYNGAGNFSLAFAASNALSRELRVQASYYESHSLGPATAHVDRSLVATAQEVVNSRISANLTVTVSNGQTSASFGGSLLSNLATISADYQTFYVPTRPGNPFEQALVLDVDLNLFGRMKAHGATFVSPTGKLLYTADLHAAQGVDGAVAPTIEHASLAECLVKGRIVDRSGLPVEGAALEVDGKLVFTDSEGRFFLRDKRPTLHLYSIQPDKFLDGNMWHVISRPLRLESTRDSRPDVMIVVGRGKAGGLMPRQREGEESAKPLLEEPSRPVGVDAPKPVVRESPAPAPAVKAPAIEEHSPKPPVQAPQQVHPVDGPLPGMPPAPPLRAAVRHAWRTIGSAIVLVAAHVWNGVRQGVAT